MSPQKRIDLMRLLGKLLNYAAARNIDLICTCFHRTQEEQDRLRAAGKSQVQVSNHQVWRAIDLCVVKDGEPVWERCEEYELLGQRWKDLGGIWGGDWRSLNDIYHFEV